MSTDTHARRLAEGKLLFDEPAEGVARLTIANPAKRNALDHAILDAIAATLVELADPQSGARCLMLTGSDGMFSAGYEIGAITDGRFQEEAERLVAHPFTAAIDLLEAFPFPTMAVLPGHAIGGGLELALTCDLRIAADGIRLGMPPAKLGLVYSHTGLRRFIDTIGVPRTRELFLLGSYVEATTAQEWGLVNRIAPAEQLDSAALELASELAANAPLSQTGNKRVIAALLRARDALTPEIENELIELRLESFASRDLREGMSAFAEKRTPLWRGE